MLRRLSTALLAATLLLTAAGRAQDMPEVARSLMEDADRAREANRIDDAISKYRRVIEVAPTLASAYVNLGAIYFKQGKVAEAEPFFRAALAMRQRLYPKADHADLARSLNNLGGSLQDQGQHTAAEPFLRDALAMFKRLHPKADHANVATSLNNLGTLLQAQDKHAAAEPFLREWVLAVAS